jgi:hypothetical protein
MRLAVTGVPSDDLFGYDRHESSDALCADADELFQQLFGFHRATNLESALVPQVVHHVVNGLGFQGDSDLSSQSKRSTVTDVSVDSEIGRIAIDIADGVQLELRPETLPFFVDHIVDYQIRISFQICRPQTVECVRLVAKEDAEFVLALLFVVF